MMITLPLYITSRRQHFHNNTITTRKQHNHNTNSITTLSLHHYCTTTAPSLLSIPLFHGRIWTLALHLHYTITVLYHTITTLTTITVLSMHHFYPHYNHLTVEYGKVHYTCTTPSLCYHCAITTPSLPSPQSLCYQCTITTLTPLTTIIHSRQWKRARSRICWASARSRPRYCKS
jgi:hypothetical protein